jgi:hypothetical protein
MSGARDIELLFRRTDSLADPELVAGTDLVADRHPELSGKRRAGACDHTATASPAKYVVIRDGGWVRRAILGLEVRDGTGQVLSRLTAEDETR